MEDFAIDRLFWLPLIGAVGCAGGNIESEERQPTIPTSSGTDTTDPQEDTGSGGTGGATTEPTTSQGALPPDPTDSGSDTQTADPGNSTGNGAECGNGVIDEGEDCDGDALGEVRCVDLGEFTAGSPTCSKSCSFDTASCFTTPNPLVVCEDIGASITDPLTVSGTIEIAAGDAPGTITETTVDVDLAHTYIGDLTIELRHENIGSMLYSRNCGEEDDLIATFTDSAKIDFDCANPTSASRVRPVQPLAAFDGQELDGSWILSVTDLVEQDDGVFRRFCVSLAWAE